MVARIIISVLAGVVIIPFAHSVNQETEQQALSPLQVRQQTTVGYRDGEIIVKYKNNVNSKSLTQFHQNLGGEISRDFPQLPTLQVIKSRNDMTVAELLNRYRNNSAVEYAEPNYIVRVQVEPNDARYTDMWSLNNIGQTGGTPDADINAPQAWDITTGSADIVVASIDSGVDYSHSDLSDNMWINPGEIAGNNIDDDNNGYIDDIHGINAIVDSGDPMDDNGHGTHTAGTMAARGNNSIGVAGVSWNAKIVACRFIDEFGFGAVSDAIQCLDYLLQLKTRAQNPVNIVVSNNSWGGGGFSQALRDAIEAHQNAGILFVAAAGNAGSNNDDRASYPAAYDLPGIVAVAATDHNDTLAFFSNFGRNSVDVGAPGLNILSTLPFSNCNLCQNPNGYGTLSGTSMAAPHVAGLAALLKAQDPARDIFAIKNLIMSGGQVTPGADGVVLSGRRIRAADVNGQGSLTCNNQELREFLVPPVVIATAGSAIPLSALQINCAQALSDPIDVTVLPDNTVVTLLDNGTGIDQIAGDGMASAAFVASATGSLELPDNQSIPINIVENYGHPLVSAANYRNLNSNTEQSLNLSLDTFAEITSPFPIQFGGEDNAFTAVYALSHGVITFDRPTIAFTNTALPLAGANTWLAPYWDDIWPGALDAGDNVYWDVQGTAPNRELIIEYRDLTHFSLRSENQRITFQVVFFENSSDVLFNYADVDFSNSRFNNGAQATIGLQVASGEAREFSVDSAGAIADGQALRWALNNFIDIDAGTDQIVNRGAAVTLDASNITNGNLADIVSYQWTQVTGPNLSLENSDAAIATFTAPDNTAVMQFDLKVTDSNGLVGNDRVNVRTNTGPQASASAFNAVNFGEFGLLLGFNSFDPDGNLESYQWLQTDGTPVQISGAESSFAFFIAPSTPEILSFELTVTDSLGLSTSDTVNIRVNNPPTADAGGAQSVRTGDRVMLNNGSIDTDGDIIFHEWVQTSGTSVTLSGASAAAASFIANEAGTYQFRLTVTDNDGASDSDTVSVEVNNRNKSGGAADWLLLALLLVFGARGKRVAARR